MLNCLLYTVYYMIIITDALMCEHVVELILTTL